MAGQVKPRRVRPAIRRLAIWTLPVLVLIAAWQVWDGAEARRLQRALAPFLGAGPTVPGLPAGADDAARYYAAAAIAAVGRNREWQAQAAPGEPVVDVLWALRDSLSRGATPAVPVLEAASRQVERDKVVLDLLRQASASPFGGFSPGTEFNYRSSGLFAVNRSAGLQTLQLIMAGQGDAAATVLLDRITLLRAVEPERGFFANAAKAWFIREIATDVGILPPSTLSDERLGELDRALGGVYASNELEDAIRGEVLLRYETIRSIWEGRRRSVGGVLMRPAIRHQLVVQLQTAADAIAAARRPWPDSIRGIAAIPIRRSMLPELVPFVGAWRDATQFPVRIAEAIAAARCARMVVKVEQFRRATGSLPETLDLLTMMDKDERLDPFTGESLRYSRDAEGFVVYSVGSDAKDESGKLSPDFRPGPIPTPRTQPPPDVGVRVLSRSPTSAPPPQTPRTAP